MRQFRLCCLTATLLFTGASIEAQTVIGNTADAQVSQGSPNTTNATNSTIEVGFGGSSGAMGRNAVTVFALPNLPTGTYFSTVNFSVYYGGKTGTPNYNGDLYGLNFRTSPTVLPDDYYMGSLQPAATTPATLIQDDFVPSTVGTTTYTLNTDDTAGTGGDAKLTKFLNDQLDLSAAARANGDTAYVFFRINPDSFGTAYTRFNLYAAENTLKPKLNYSTVVRPKFFAPTSFYNTDITGLPPAADQSDAQKLVNQVAQYHTVFNNYQYSVPIYVVPKHQPTIAVTDTDGYCNSKWTAVPLPPGASGAAGNDKAMVVWQPETDKMWEFWRIDVTDPTHPTAVHGGRLDNASTSSGIFPYPYGLSATGLANASGIVTLDEGRRIANDPNYTIPHALALQVVQSTNTHVAPANRHDTFLGTNAIPEGRRFRLPPNYDVDTQLATAPPLVKAIARAAQKYGLYVRDHAGTVALLGEDNKTRPGQATPWNSSVYGSKASYNVLESFPWSQLQVLDPP